MSKLRSCEIRVRAKKSTESPPPPPIRQFFAITPIFRRPAGMKLFAYGNACYDCNFQMRDFEHCIQACAATFFMRCFVVFLLVVSYTCYFDCYKFNKLDLCLSHRNTTVWSASSDGQIVGWDPVTLTTKKEVRRAHCSVTFSDSPNGPTVLPAWSV